MTAEFLLASLVSGSCIVHAGLLSHCYVLQGRTHHSCYYHTDIILVTQYIKKVPLTLKFSVLLMQLFLLPHTVLL